MLFFDILHAIVGIIFSLFIPGYLLTLILFDKLDIIERIGLTIGLSMCVYVLIGLLLGGSKTMMDLTGGITAVNLWIFIGSLSLILFIGVLFKNKFNWRSLILR